MHPAAPAQWGVGLPGLSKSESRNPKFQTSILFAKKLAFSLPVWNFGFRAWVFLPSFFAGISRHRRYFHSNYYSR
jgi:hypothetical protein